MTQRDDTYSPTSVGRWWRGFLGKDPERHSDDRLARSLANLGMWLDRLLLAAGLCAVAALLNFLRAIGVL